MNLPMNTPNLHSTPSAPYSGLKIAHDRAREHLVRRVGPDGALRAACGSRILESALMLTLLERQRVLPQAQAQLAAYLQAAPRHGPFDGLVARAATGRTPSVDETGAFLASFSHSTGARKQLLLQSILRLLGCEVPPTGEIPDYRGHATWTSLILCAIGMAEAAGTADGEARRAYVTGVLAQWRGQVFEGNALAHLVALHCLHQVDPGHPAIGDGIGALEAIRDPGGGMPFNTGQEIFVTALAALCLARAGAEGDLLERMGDFLAGAQLPDGGWGYAILASQSDVDDASRCLEALRAIGASRYREALDRGERYLLSMAGADGSFPTYVRGHEGTVDMTAGAILALGPRLGERLTTSADFIASKQHWDGTFPVSWTVSTASVASRAIDALEASGLHSNSVQRAVRSLAGSQNADGGFGQRLGMPSDVLSTAQAVQALAGRAPGRVVPDALNYLTERQHGDGSFTSVPDQVGPRPIPYDFPILATVHSLFALTSWSIP